MDYTIIDAHAHLWLRQDTVVDGLPIRTLENGRSEFMGEIRQMVPPFMVDGVNSAEVFLSNMDYAQVAAAVITQEFIDGIQNDYLSEVVSHYPNRFFVCGMCEFRKPGFLEQAKELITKGFKAIKIPAQRLLLKEGRVMLNNEEMMQMFHSMEERNVMLSIDLADGATQVPEMEEIIQECPRLKIAVGHFGMVTRPDWKEQIRLARHPNVMIESGGITWLFNDEFYPFKGAVKAIREAADLVGMEKTDVGIGLSAHHYSNHLQDVIRFCGEVFRVDGRGQKTLFGRKCPELLWIHGSPRTSLHQEHVRMIEKTSLS